MASSSSGALSGASGNEHSSDKTEIAVNTQARSTSPASDFHNHQPSENLENTPPASNQPLVSSPLEMSPMDPPSSPFPSSRDYNRNSYTETDYTSKRFRSEQYAEERSNDAETFRTAPSSSTTWMPPEDADEELTELRNPISPEKVLNSGNDYTGPVLYPGQLSSLTMYGYPRGAFSSTKENIDATEMNATVPRSRRPETDSASRGQSGRHGSKTREVAYEVGAGEASRGSFETSSPGTQSNFGVPLSDTDTTSSTFAVRAKQAGIPDWNEKVAKGLVGNNSVFDGRWVLNSHEAWNVPARKHSVLTISPRSQRSVRSTRSALDGSSSSSPKIGTLRDGKQSSQETLSPLKDQKPSKVEADLADAGQLPEDDKDSQDDRKLNEDVEEGLEDSQGPPERQDVTEAIEAKRLEDYITDLSNANDDLRSKLSTYHPTTIHKIFCERVFYNPCPEAPRGGDAMRLVKHKGKIITYGNFYRLLLSEINQIVAFMTNPSTRALQAGATSSRNSRTVEYGQRARLTKDGTSQQATRPGTGRAQSNEEIHQSSHDSLLQPRYPTSRPHEMIAHDTERKEQLSVEPEDRLVPAVSPLLQRQAQHGALRTHTGLTEQIQQAAQRSPEEIAKMTNKNISRIATQNSHHLLDFIEPFSGTREEGDFAATGDSDLRVQTRLGDPATAEFSPSTGSPYPSADQKGIFATTSEDLRLYAPFPPPGLPANSQAMHEGRGNVYPGFTELKPSMNSSEGYSDSQADLTQPATVAAGYSFERRGSVLGTRPYVSSVRNEYNSSLRGPLIADRRGSSAQERREILVSSQSPYIERSFQDMAPPGAYAQPLRQNHPQYHVQHLLQAQMRPQTPEESLRQYSPETIIQSQGFHGPIGQLQLGPIHINRAERYPVPPPPGFTQSAFSTSSSHNFGVHDQLVQSPLQQNLNWAPMNPYEHKMRLPYTQTPEHETYSEQPSSHITPTVLAGQPYTYGPNAELHPSSSYGAIPIATGSSYVQPYIPADKYARAPAPNRLASRFAQVHALQPIQTTGAFIKSSLPQSRFPTPTISPRASLTTLPYHSGSNDMFPNQRPGAASIKYQDLTRHEPPRLSIAGDEKYMPFVETPKLSKSAEWGVLKISNMPYDITRKLINAFLGTHAKIITSDLGPSIHIMMDRSTGKTQDCYVEFFSAPDANAWRAVIVRRGPHLNKIGDRVLDVEVSSQEDLLKELFPRARCVIWNGSDGPQIRETEEAFDSGFKGFITQEELKGLIHHAEQPHRSVYTQKCPPRPYANMISILSKFPWHATAHYTLSTRNALFNATLTLVKTLNNFLRRSSSLTSQGHRTNPSQDSNSSGTVPFSNFQSGTSNNMFRPDLSQNELSKLDMREKGLNEGLLKELVLAGLNAYGFSDSQRYQLYLSASSVLGRDWIRLSPLMSKWPFEVIGRKAGYEEDVVEFYAHLLSGHPLFATNAVGSTASSRPTHPQAREYIDPQLPFGNFSNELYVQNIEGYAQQSVSIQALGKWEMDVITQVIREMCANE